MSKILVITDLDGVLVENDIQEPGYAALLKNLHQQNAVWTVATGRSHFSASRVLDDLLPTVNIMVVDDGSLIRRIDGETLQTFCLTSEATKVIIETAHASCWWMNASTERHSRYHFLLGPDVSKEDLYSIWDSGYVDKVFTSADKFSVFIEEHPAMKIQIRTKDPNQVYPQIDGLTRSRLSHHPDFTGWQYSHKDGSKGEGVRLIQKELSIPASHTIVLGDAHNDYSMFVPEVASYRIAVGRNKKLIELSTHHASTREHITRILHGILREMN